MNKLKRVLLVDDCKATNYIHRLVIEKYGCAEAVVEVNNGREALEYLTTEVDGSYPKPELVFLDINMPVMNGWQFLEKYADVPEAQQAGVVVVMLTTSLNPDDASLAQSKAAVKSFSSKPLTESRLDDVLAENYPEALRR
ncbi:response regulator [Zhongshania aliphaticivorans]|uniref:response regulator n=1 Tax=Zhongshania aliphaticivorans TaxID=1470434 RepID=UPI0039C9BA1C